MDTSAIVSQISGNFSLPNFLSAVVTLLAWLLIFHLAAKGLTRLLSHTKLDRRVQGLLVSGVKTLLYVLTGVIVLQALGVNTSTFVALLSVASLGITMAAEDILGNFAGGLVLISSRPFNLGDLIESSGNLGTVEEIRLTHTRILTPDGQYIHIPNKDLAASRVINYTALGRRRIACKINASYDAPSEIVMDACLEAVSLTERILPDPAPAVWPTDCGTSSVEYTIHCWTLPADYWPAVCTLRVNLRQTFADHRIEMTYDHMNVHIVETCHTCHTTESAG